MKTWTAFGVSGIVIQMIVLVNKNRIIEIVFLVNGIAPERAQDYWNKSHYDIFYNGDKS